MNPKLLGLILALAGSLVFYFISLPDLKTAQDSKGWPDTRGQIIHAEMQRVETGTGSDRSISYRPDIRYSYQVEGREYQSSRIGVTTGTSYSYRIAQKILRKYPKDLEVDVYYKPGEPSYAILNTGVRASEILLAASMLFFVMLGLLILFNVIKATPVRK